MSNNEKTWLKIGDIIDQIAATQAEIKAAGGVVVADESDHQAFEILERIELRMTGAMPAQPAKSANSWDHPDWKEATRESLEESMANSPPPIIGARNFWQACRMVDARNARHQRLPEAVPEPIPQATIDATLWLRKFHPERLPAWYAVHPGLEKHIDKHAF